MDRCSDATFYYLLIGKTGTPALWEAEDPVGLNYQKEITRPAGAPIALKPGGWPKARGAGYNRRSLRRRRL